MVQGIDPCFNNNKQPSWSIRKSCLQRTEWYVQLMMWRFNRLCGLDWASSSEGSFEANGEALTLFAWKLEEMRLGVDVYSKTES